MEATQTLEFDSLEDIKWLPEETLLIPRKGDNECVDALLVPDTVLQITVAKRHSVNLSGLYLAAKVTFNERTTLSTFDREIGDQSICCQD